ncbi:MAG: M56 family metallopeptidase [Anaerovoracaceae bacterium]
MEQIFLKVLNMSLMASWVILILLLLRPVLKKAPGWVSAGLWIVVLFRLLCPVSFESPFSLMRTRSQSIPENIAMNPKPQIDSGSVILDSAVNRVLETPVFSPDAGASMNPLQFWITIGTWIWTFGIAVMVICSAVSLYRLQKCLKTAVPLSEMEDCVFVCSCLETAFVVGIARPKIYLPSGLREDEREYILCHEKMHIQRKDALIKVLAFAALCIHWFNPLAWAAFLLLGRDMEQACDEAVLRELGSDVSLKKAYSASLLSLAVGRRIMGGGPLAFGEGEVKSRVKNVLQYRKPTIWASAAAIVLCVVLAFALLANRADDRVKVKYLDSLEDVMDEAGTVWWDMEAWYDSCRQQAGTIWIWPLEQLENDAGKAGYIVYYRHGMDHYSCFTLDVEAKGKRLLFQIAEKDAVNDSQVRDELLALVTFDADSFILEEPTQPRSSSFDTRADFSFLTDLPDGTLSDWALNQLNRLFEPTVVVKSGEQIATIVNPNNLHCFFTSYYDNPSQITFGEFLRYCQSPEPMADEEKIALADSEQWKAVWGNEEVDTIPVPTHKYSSSGINVLLEYYAGIMLADLSDENRSQVMYFEPYDSYYTFTSDFGPGIFSCTRGEKSDDTIRLYREISGTQADSVCLTLKYRDGRYLIQSFLPVQPGITDR